MNPPQTHYSSLSVVVRLYCNTIFLGQKTPAGLESACLKWDQFSFPLISTFPFLMLPSSLSLVFIVYTFIYVCVWFYIHSYTNMAICAEPAFVRRNLKKWVALWVLWRLPRTQEPHGERYKDADAFTTLQVCCQQSALFPAKLYICAAQGRLLDGQPWGRMRKEYAVVFPFLPSTEVLLTMQTVSEVRLLLQTLPQPPFSSSEFRFN